MMEMMWYTKSSFHFSFVIFRLLFGTPSVFAFASQLALFQFSKEKKNRFCWLNISVGPMFGFRFHDSFTLLFVENFPSPWHSFFLLPSIAVNVWLLLLRMNWLRSLIKIIFNYALKLPGKFAIACVCVCVCKCVNSVESVHCARCTMNAYKMFLFAIFFIIFQSLALRTVYFYTIIQRSKTQQPLDRSNKNWN